MKKFLLSCLTILPSLLFAQFQFDRSDFENVKKDTVFTPTQSISLSGFNYNYSNSISNSLMNAALFNGFISDDVKNDTYKMQKNKNRSGVEQGFDLNYKVKMGSGNFTARYRDRVITSAFYNENVLKLVLSGNSVFAGQKTTISPAEITKLGYQSFMLGYEKTLKNDWFIGGGISVVKSGEYRLIELQNATFYTEQYGDSVEVSGYMNLQEADKKTNRFKINNGLGFSVDLYVSKKINNTTFNFELQDIGLMNYKKLARSYEGDTSIKYKGKDLLDGFSVSDTSLQGINNQNPESILNLPSNPKKLQRVMPGLIHLNIHHKINEKLALALGARYLINTYKIPQVYFRADFALPAKFSVSPILAYGGLSGFDLGVAIQKKLGNHLFLSTNVFYIESAFVPKKSAGQGVSFALSYLF